MRYSLRQLLTTLLVWLVCFAAIHEFYPSWVYALISAGAATAIVVFSIRTQSLRYIAALLFPVVCLLQWSSFAIAFDHAFGGDEITTTLLGPVAQFVSWPVVVIQNSLPLVHPWDTFIGIVTISLIETIGLIFLLTLWRRICARKAAVA